MAGKLPRRYPAARDWHRIFDNLKVGRGLGTLPIREAKTISHYPKSDTTPNGNTESVTINGAGLVAQTSDFAGDVTLKGYDNAGNKISETDANQHTATFTPDADNRTVQDTSPMGKQDKAVLLDKDGNVLQEQNPAQQITQMFYDPMSRRVLSIDPLGFLSKTVYDLAGRVVADINEVGAKTQYQYDGDSAVVAVTDPDGNKTQTVFDGDRNVVQTIDGRGNPTNYTFNKDNYDTSATDANNNKTVYTVNLAGETTKVTDPKNNAYNYTFDVSARPTSVTDPDNNKTQWLPDADGNVVKTTDARNYSTKASFDALDRMTSDTPPAGAGDAVTFDGVGNIKSQTAAGIKTQFLYNPDDGETTEINAKGGSTIFDLGVMGEVRAQYDPNNVPTLFGYNGDWQQDATTLGTGALTFFTLNPAGQTVAEKDADNNNTVFQLDKVGNAIATIDPFGKTSTQTFDGDYNPITSTDRDGNTITNTFDPGNRLTAQSQVAPNGAQSDNLAFTFDKNNNMLTAANSYGTYTFTPDAANFVTSQKDPFNLTLTFTPDADYNVTKVVDSAGGTQNNVFDVADRLQSRQFSTATAQARIDIGYTGDSQVASLTRYSDTAGLNLVGSTTNGYDALGTITSMVHKNAANTVLESFTYSVDNAGRVNSETDTISGNAVTTNYGFDQANQLTSANSTNYGYTLNGNRNNNGFQVGPNNQLLSDGNWNYQYDPQQNLIEKDGIGANAGLKWVFAYNALNEMTSATETNNGSPVVQETNSFDVFQNLIEQDVSLNGGAASVTKFALQVTNLAGSASGTGNLAPLWANLNSNNQVTSRSESIDAVDAVFAEIGSSGTIWPLFDHLNSNRGLMNNTGSLADALTYGAFGNITSESNSANADFIGFAGGRRDFYTFDVWLGWRQEDTGTGRFTTQDPLDLGPGPNPNEYVKNNPVNFIDPTGLVGGVRHHPYPLYLGGSNYQVVFVVPSVADHNAAHNYLASHGFPLQNPNEARRLWLATPAPERRRLIIGSMRAAGIPESMINQHIGEIIRRAHPGWEVTRIPGYYHRLIRVSRRTGEIAAGAILRGAGRVVGGAARFATGPYGMAITELLLEPTPLAGGGGLTWERVVPAPSGPQPIPLPRGTYILPNRQVYVPLPEDIYGASDFVPPPGSLVVIQSTNPNRRVTGQMVAYGQPYPAGSVAPITSLPWILLIPENVTEAQARNEYMQYLQRQESIPAGRYSRNAPYTETFTEWLTHRYYWQLRNGR